MKYPDGEEKGTAGAFFSGYIAVSVASSMIFLVLAFIYNFGTFEIIIIYILSGAAGIFTLAFLIILRESRRANQAQN